MNALADNTTESFRDERLEKLIENAWVFRTPTGTPALSLDDGLTLHDPRGRTVKAVGAWTEADDDPEDVWSELTDDQREAVLNILAHKEERAAASEAKASDILAELKAFKAEGRWGVQQQRRIADRTFYLNGMTLCAGFVKKGGYRVWLLAISDEDAVALAMRKASLRYRTNSKRAWVVYEEAK